MKICFAVVLLFSQNILAATNLSWKESLELLKKNNLDVKSSLATYESVVATESGSYSGYWPSLSGSLSYTQAKSDSAYTSSGQTYASSLNLTQNLFAGLKDSAKHDQAVASTRQARANMRASLVKISSDFASAYENLSFSQEYLKLAQTIMQRRQENLRLVELRYEGGRENKGSVLLSKAYLEQAKLESLQAHNDEDVSQESIKKILVLDSKEKISLTDTVPTQDVGKTPDFEALTMQTTDIELNRAVLDSNISAITVSRSAFFPNLNLSASTGKSGSDVTSMSDKWSLGATLSIPIFDGKKDLAALQSSKLVAESSHHQLASTADQTALKLKQAYNKYIESIQKLKVDESFREAAMVRAEIARAQYNNGLVSFTDWDVIENDLIAREKAYLQSKRERILNEISWKQVLGEGVIE